MHYRKKYISMEMAIKMFALSMSTHQPLYWTYLLMIQWSHDDFRTLNLCDVMNQIDSLNDFYIRKSTLAIE